MAILLRFRRTHCKIAPTMSHYRGDHTILAQAEQLVAKVVTTFLSTYRYPFCCIAVAPKCSLGEILLQVLPSRDHPTSRIEDTPVLHPQLRTRDQVLLNSSLPNVRFPNLQVRFQDQQK